MTWLIIYNPNAGIKKGEADREKIGQLLEQSELNYKMFFTQSVNHATQLTQDHISKDCKDIIVVGGDGTINEVVNGILKQNKVPVSEIKLGVIPIGVGNDWGKMFDIPNDYEKAINTILNNKITSQDIGLVEYKNGKSGNKRYFVNVAGLGFDAVVLKNANKNKEKGKSGQFVYFKTLFLSLLKYKSLQTKFTIDGNKIHSNLLSANIGICKYSGNGMMQVPNAIHNDGLFDITIIDKMRKFEVIRNVKNLYDGSFIKNKKVLSLKGKNISIDGHPKLFMEADGEFLGTPPFNFSIIPQKLAVLIGENPQF